MIRFPSLYHPSLNVFHLCCYNINTPLVIIYHKIIKPWKGKISGNRDGKVCGPLTSPYSPILFKHAAYPPSRTDKIFIPTHFSSSFLSTLPASIPPYLHAYPLHPPRHHRFNTQNTTFKFKFYKGVYQSLSFDGLYQYFKRKSSLLKKQTSLACLAFFSCVKFVSSQHHYLMGLQVGFLFHGSHHHSNSIIVYLDFASRSVPLTN